MRDDGLEQRLVAIVHSSAPLMAALRAVRALGLPAWCIGAGAVRSLVWDRLHGFEQATALDEGRDAIEVVAPHGLDDLFALRVRHNPLRASLSTYRSRVASKRFAERWPRLCID